MVQLFTEFEKFVSVLLHRDARAELLNAFTFSLVHAAEVSQRARYRVCSMSNANRNSALVSLVQESQLPSISLRFESPKVRLPASGSREIDREALTSK